MSANAGPILLDLPGDLLGFGEDSRAGLWIAVEKLTAPRWPMAAEIHDAEWVSVPEHTTVGLPLARSPAALWVRVQTRVAPDAILMGSSPQELAGAEVPPGPYALGHVRAGGERQLPVRLVDLDLWPESDLAQSLDYYLTCPTLETPVEPWHSLAVALAGGPRIDLWRAELSVVGRNAYVSADGLVTLSARFARRNAWFGKLTEGLEGWRASELWGQLSRHRLSLFLNRTECAFCDAFPSCEGYWAAWAAEDPVRCAAWRSLMDRLASAGRRAVQSTEEARPAPEGTHVAGRASER